MEDALAAVTKGNPLPTKVLLKITGAGGYHSGISGKLKKQGITWEDLTGHAVRDARKQDVAQAKQAGVRPGRPVTHSATTGGAPMVATQVSKPDPGHLVPTSSTTTTPSLRSTGFKLLTPKIQFRLPGMKLRGVAGGALMALVTIVAGKLVDEGTEKFVQSQIKDLQPEIENRVRKEAEWGLVAYNAWGRRVPLYINVTLDVMTDSTIDPDLRQRTYGAPTASIEAVAIETRNRDGETSHKQDVRAFVIFDHQYFTSSIPLDSLIEQIGLAVGTDDRASRNPSN